MRDGVGVAVSVDVVVAVAVRVGLGEGVVVGVSVGVGAGAGLLAQATPPANPATSNNTARGKKINPRLMRAILDENAQPRKLPEKTTSAIENRSIALK